jgi:signal transduction histidine kinase
VKGAKATKSMTEKDIKRARLKLAFLYFITIFLILNAYAFISSSANLAYLENINPQNMRPLVVQRRPKTLEQLTQADREEIQARITEARESLILTNIALQLILLTVAGTASYILSGETLKPIIRAHKQQQNFIARASHELKTPLTIIKLHAESIENSKDPDKLQKFRTSVVEETTHMQELVNKLVQSLKLNLWNYKQEGKVKLNPVINNVISRYEHLAKSKNIKITYDQKPGQEVEVKFGSSELEEVLSILLDNAIKYNKENGAVNIIVKLSKSKAVIRITDTGIGIPEAEISKVFSKFYRGVNEEIEGFGLGLAIAKQIIQAYSGSIAIESEEAKGTTIILKLLRA